MDTLQFVTLAKSNDETRFNLAHVYRDIDALVATDGHRMHYAPMTAIEKGHFVSGIDGEFPQWRQVIPSGDVKHSICLDRNEWLSILPSIKALLQVAKVVSKRTPIATLNYSMNGFMLEVGQGAIKASFKSEGFASEKVLGRIGLNLSYLIDALPLGKGDATHAQIDIRSELSPIHITHQLGMAVIMPIRLEGIEYAKAA